MEVPRSAKVHSFNSSFLTTSCIVAVATTRMHSYGAWSATIRRAVACKFPTVVSSSATWAHRSGSCPRFRNSRRYFYPTYPGHGGISSSRRHYSASMENKEDTLLRAQATLAKLTSLTPRSAAHLGCLLSAAEQTESNPSSSSVQITGAFDVIIAYGHGLRQMHSLWAGPNSLRAEVRNSHTRRPTFI